MRADFNIEYRGLGFFSKFIGIAVLAVFFVRWSSNILFKNILLTDIQATAFSWRQVKAQINAPKSLRLASVYNIAESNINLGFVGDIMLARNVERVINSYGMADFKIPFYRIDDVLKTYDILFGNLEGPISSRGTDQGSLYSFRMDPRVAEGLAFAGFDIVNLANNHIADWGGDAVLDTEQYLKAYNIKYIGADINGTGVGPQIFNIKNTKIAYLGFADFHNSYAAFASEENIKKYISAARPQADILIVSFHFGEEYRSEPTERQKYLAHLAIDLGADLIVGHHPHVAEPLENYNGKYVIYSLGNFIFDQNFSKETMSGGLLDVKIQDKKIIGISLKNIKINGNFQPEIQ